jgi:hypothetical protein
LSIIIFPVIAGFADVAYGEVTHSSPVACAEFAIRIWLLDPAASADGTPDPVAETIFPFAVTRDFGIAAFAVVWAAAASDTPLFAVLWALAAAS